MKSGKGFTVREKQAAVRLCRAGVSSATVAAAFGARKMQVAAWLAWDTMRKG